MSTHYREHLVITAIEEAGELIQELSKLLRFGNEDQMRERIVHEFSDLVAVMESLNYKTDMNVKVNKMNKVRHYYQATYLKTPEEL